MEGKFWLVAALLRGYQEGLTVFKSIHANECMDQQDLEKSAVLRRETRTRQLAMAWVVDNRSFVARHVGRARGQVMKCCLTIGVFFGLFFIPRGETTRVS